jgi:DNA-binding transcriptional MerR regulator
MDTRLTIGETVEATGLSEDTLRYYERIGLITDVERNESGHRRYTPCHLWWIGLVVRMRNSGMTLETLVRYAKLAARGASTIAQRRDILKAHQEAIGREAARLAELDVMLQRKIATYDAIVAGGAAAGAPCEEVADDAFARRTGERTLIEALG